MRTAHQTQAEAVQAAQAEADKDGCERGVWFVAGHSSAKDDLLACYRIGKRPSEALFKRLDKAKEVLDNIAAEQPKPQQPEVQP